MPDFDDEDDEKKVLEEEISVDMVGGIIRSPLDFISGNDQA